MPTVETWVVLAAVGELKLDSDLGCSGGWFDSTK